MFNSKHMHPWIIIVYKCKPSFNFFEVKIKNLESCIVYLTFTNLEIFKTKKKTNKKIQKNFNNVVHIVFNKFK